MSRYKNRRFSHNRAWKRNQKYFLLWRRSKSYVSFVTLKRQENAINYLKELDDYMTAKMLSFTAGMSKLFCDKETL